MKMPGINRRHRKAFRQLVRSLHQGKWDGSAHAASLMNASMARLIASSKQVRREQALLCDESVNPDLHLEAR